MRLSKIKLAGFKSFVDPTTLSLVSNLTAIAGPNGCGKSNVIDAVRWVLGESSAKNLRGGALTDVIFSGSAARKPIGQATVELLFENAQGKLGGEYAAYSEIAIKRQVTREGQSTYFLNGQRCRRKDVTDIFLGTGLGPRSYAIIEQGMISRVVDAKPDDLRIFLEEAAGISKYKERRRETENRLKHTHDNLSRLNDIRQELETQLKHLEKQAQAATQYRELKTQEKDKHAQLSAMVWSRLDEKIKMLDDAIRQAVVAIEAEQTHLTHAKSEQEKKRVELTEVNDALNEVQKRYYAIGTEIAKIEQSIAHQQSRKEEVAEQKTEATNALSQSKEQMVEDEANIKALKTQLDELTPEFEALSEVEEVALEKEHAQELQLEQFQSQLDALQQAYITPSKEAEAHKAKISGLERQLQLAHTRLEKCQSEKAQVPADDPGEIDILAEKIELIEQSFEQKQDEVNACNEQRGQWQAKRKLLQATLLEKQQIVNQAKGQQSALEALQRQAFGNEEEHKQAWCEQQGLELSHLAQRLEVKPGWEKAMEMVLGEFLEALVVEESAYSEVARELSSLKDSALNVDLIQWKLNEAPPQQQGDSSLLAGIQGTVRLPKTIITRLSAVQVRDNLAQALELLTQLDDDASVVTLDGFWLGKEWARVHRDTDNQVGVLEREQKLKTLNATLQDLTASLDEAESGLEECEEAIRCAEDQKEEAQRLLNQHQQECVTMRGELKIKQSRLEQKRTREAQLSQEIIEYDALIRSSQEEIDTSREQLQHALEKMSAFTQEKDALEQTKKGLQAAYLQSRTNVKEVQKQKQELALRLQTYRTQATSFNESVSRLLKHIATLERRLEQILEVQEGLHEPLLAFQDDLETQLEKRMDVEQQLNLARDKVAEVDAVIHELDKTASQHEHALNSLREKTEESKLQWQALSVRKEQALEQLKDIEVSIESLLDNVPDDATESSLESEIGAITRKIQRLGAINLAAIDECQAANERKHYLDAQCIDLEEALTTLENAIRKIDKETRSKFKDVFDDVNDKFMKLFPQLFGGGHAELQLTGEDLLDTGVSLIARPPGKKNSTIQQLSGGEKSLTAIALVFSIFQLNPAPFCMLDEVDAPLDDNNVVRFCDLVKNMSQSVQFIYISHNKLTIEMAEQLQGVTMREPGVSRLVTVDIEEAKSMAEA